MRLVDVDGSLSEAARRRRMRPRVPEQRACGVAHAAPQRLGPARPGSRPIARRAVARRRAPARSPAAVLDFELGEDARDVVAHRLLAQLQRRARSARCRGPARSARPVRARAASARRTRGPAVRRCGGAEELAHLLEPARPGRVLLEHQVVARCRSGTKRACGIRPAIRRPSSNGTRRSPVACSTSVGQAHLRQQRGDVDLVEHAHACAPRCAARSTRAPAR